MSCGCLTCPGVRDVMGVFNRSKLVGLQGTSSVPEGFINARDPRDYGRLRPIKFIRIYTNHTHLNISLDYGPPYHFCVRLNKGNKVF